jgi:hypothetical protein
MLLSPELEASWLRPRWPTSTCMQVKLDQGGRRRIILRDQIIVPWCPHDLPSLSVGEEALRGN